MEDEWQKEDADYRAISRGKRDRHDAKQGKFPSAVAG